MTTTNPNVGCRRNLLVETAANEVANAVTELNAAVADLEDRLQPLMRVAHPTPCDPCVPQQVDSEIGRRLTSEAGCIRSRCTQIRELIERL